MKVGWLDRLIAWATSRRVPWWALLLTVWALAAALVAGSWWLDHADDTYQLRLQLLSTFYGVFALAMYGYLGVRAGRAFDSFRPALADGDDEADSLRRSLVSMPRRTALITGLVGLGIGVLAGVADPALVDLAGSDPLFVGVVVAITLGASISLFLMVVVQLIRVLSAVARLHRRAAHVDLFATGPAHAFARVTVLAGVYLLVNVSYSMATDPSTFENPVWITFLAGSGLVAVAAFITPLLGMRRRLVEAKAALQGEAQGRIAVVTSEVHRVIDAGRYGDVAPARAALDALEAERTRVRKASVWPWETATLRGFSTALVLPVLTWLVTTTLTRLLDL